MIQLCILSIFISLFSATDGLNLHKNYFDHILADSQSYFNFDTGYANSTESNNDWLTFEILPEQENQSIKYILISSKDLITFNSPESKFSENTETTNQEVSCPKKSRNLRSKTLNTTASPITSTDKEIRIVRVSMKEEHDTESSFSNPFTNPDFISSLKNIINYYDYLRSNFIETPDNETLCPYCNEDHTANNESNYKSTCPVENIEINYKNIYAQEKKNGTLPDYKTKLKKEINKASVIHKKVPMPGDKATKEELEAYRRKMAKIGYPISENINLYNFIETEQFKDINIKLIGMSSNKVLQNIHNQAKSDVFKNGCFKIAVYKSTDLKEIPTSINEIDYTSDKFFDLKTLLYDVGYRISDHKEALLNYISDTTDENMENARPSPSLLTTKNKQNMENPESEDSNDKSDEGTTSIKNKKKRRRGKKKKKQDSNESTNPDYMSLANNNNENINSSNNKVQVQEKRQRLKSSKHIKQSPAIINKKIYGCLPSYGDHIKFTEKLKTLYDYLTGQLEYLSKKDSFKKYIMLDKFISQILNKISGHLKILYSIVDQFNDEALMFVPEAIKQYQLLEEFDHRYILFNVHFAQLIQEDYKTQIDSYLRTHGLVNDALIEDANSSVIKSFFLE